MKFSKWHGLGNDFIFVEPEKNPGVNISGMARRLCDRHFGIGADGVVTLRNLGGNAFEMRIYNSDGSECEMCGNAMRCAGLYIKTRKMAPGPVFDVHTRAGIIHPAVLCNNTVRVDMGEPRFLRGDIPVSGTPGSTAHHLMINVDGTSFTGCAVSMGNPHVVIFVPRISNIELEKWGPQIENNPLFPKKTNVEFVEIISRTLVRMRVWERGCGVTFACGTGSCAVVAAGTVTGRLDTNVSVLLDGGELQIEYSSSDNRMYMTGPATEVFAGEYLERI